MTEDNFRLVRVEARVDEIGTGLLQLRGDVQDLSQLSADVSDIRETLHKQRGFIAGVSFAFTLILSAVGAALSYFWDR